MALSAVMAVGLLPSTSVALTEGPGLSTSLPGLKQPKPVPVVPLGAGDDVKRPNDAAAKAAARAVWPAAGAQTVPVEGAGALLPKSAAVGTPLPVTVTAVAEKASKAAPLTRARISVEPRAKAQKAGVDGLLLSVGRADGVAAGGRARVTVDYAAFKDAYGGDWGARLKLVQLPACALTTPDKAACRVAKPLATTNDTKNQKLSAVAPVPAAKGTTALAPTAMTVLAATAGASGPTGTFKATSLEASGAWSAGGATGAFTWSYPVGTPAVPGGLKPDVTLGYNSQAVDGRTAASNNQAGWIGDGWSYEPGYIERRYKSCEDDKTGGTNTAKVGDPCWYTDNATLSLGGKTTELVYDATKGWHPVSDGGEKIEKLTGASNGDLGAAGAKGEGGTGEYWKITTLDGTQYYFGRNRLPGWATGNPETNSTLNAPVFGNHAGEPCYNASFAAAWCQQAWRWNLDYVVDPRGNAMAYFWKKEKNNYGRNTNPTTGASTKTSYDRGGYLDRVEYGLRDGSPYAAKAMGRVTFTSGDRCEAASCTFDAANSARWPDTPFDLYCADSATECKSQISPSFWSNVRLKTIATQVLSGGAYKDVDSWELTQTFPPSGDGISKPMWLAGLWRKAKDGAATADVPPITFAGEQKPNRVDNLGDGLAPFIRLRMSKITTETGGTTGIWYHAPDCTNTTLPPLDATNGTRCFPVKWEAEGSTPKQDWFNSYVVSRVVEGDNVSATPDVTTEYSYVGGAEWAKNEDEFTKAEYREYSEPRGYYLVQTRKGAGLDPRTLSETRYFRGIAGAAVKNTAGVSVTDRKPFAGMPRERVTYNGDGGAFVGSTSYTPWISPSATAARTRPGLPDLEAFMTGTEGEETRTAVTGGERTTRTVHGFDEYGLVKTITDLGDTARAGDEKCTELTYARTGSSAILDKVARAETYAVACAMPVSKPDDIVDDVRTYYDGKALGEAPTKGLVTKVDRINGKGDGYDVTSSVPSTCGADGKQLCFDVYGRQLAAADAYGAVTRTDFTPPTGEVPTGTAVTNPLLHKVTTVLDPRRGQPTKITDANGKVKSMAYDPLGRITKAWLPTRSQATYPTSPNFQFSYLVRTNGPIVTTTQSLSQDNKYKTGYSFQDGLLRTLQTQQDSPDRAGRLITEQFYNSRGEAVADSGSYYATGIPEPNLVTGQQTMYPSSTETLYDGAGRVTAVIAKRYTVETKRTTTTYTGDTTTVVPPAGGTATTTVVDALGRTTEVKEYTNAARTASQSLSYAYDKRGRIEKVTDASGAEWSYGYDVRGRQTDIKDPDKGNAHTDFDVGDRATDVTDARDIKLHTDYDALGRPTTLKKGAKPLAEWTYDATGSKGLPAKATRYDEDGNAWVTETSSYNGLDQPGLTKFTVPATETGLAGTYEWFTTYNPNTGQVTDVEQPAMADLPYEMVSTGYTSVTGLLDTVNSDDHALISKVTYDHYGHPTRTEYSEFGRHVWTSNEYDEHTGNLTRSYTDRDTAPQRIEDTAYTYDPAGNITKVAAAYGQDAARTTDTQCFQTDALRRITEAWTNTGTDCAAAPSDAVVGGQDAYWTSYTYDAVGNRKTEVQHKTPTGPTEDTTRTYADPAKGKHDLPSVTQTGGTARTDAYTYDKAGNTATRKIGDADLETFDWDDEGHLKSTTKVTDTTEYLYDTAGARLLRRDSTGTTLYLPGGNELHKDKNDKVTGTRYYGDYAVLKGGKLTFVLADQNGTSTTQIAHDAPQVVTRRKTTIFGGPRGTQPTDWLGDKGFVGGTNDADTSLVHIGAREYDPVTGRFISVDPLLELEKLQTLSGYSYAANNPVAFSDPTGLGLDDGTGHTEREDGKSGQGDGRPRHSVGGEPTVNDAAANTNPVNQTEDFISTTARKHLGTKRYAEWRQIYKRNITHFTGWDPSEQDLMAAAANSCWGRGSYSCPPVLQEIFREVEIQRLIAVAQETGAFEGGSRIPGSPSGRSGGKISKGAGCGRCFLAGTDVQMADGSTKDIEKIVVGDEVLATDPYSGETGARKVTRLIVTDGDKLFNDLTIATPTGPEHVTATYEHPFWSVSERRWVKAEHLAPGMTLRTDAGAEVAITANRPFTRRTRTYNLTVDGLHTYYVLAGATPVLVHNAGGNGPEVPGIIQQRIAEILAGQAQPRLNGDRTGPDRFEVRTGRNNPTPGAHARKWGPSSPGANDAALIYDMGDGENRYRILVNRHGDVGWVDNHNYRNIRVYTPGC
ncbi:polymorphic toxin-type HINT domain-containing protein [Streptomyces showdoensis]|uniref:polymorphic toxin-type HINT domain-containing protein n=1 Tax=Streptomyces showdoensis TaxID=68268 RepID=UPI0010397CDF|nr:polymorphic toxin-type HINT domain-containing protein [Streptomyces showdoensis]